MSSSSSSTILAFFFILSIPGNTAPTPTQTCSSSSRSPCPPFNSSLLSYPFSSAPGCGHPFFHIHCSSTSHSSITINNLTFSLLRYDTTSIFLSPIPTQNTPSNCSISTLFLSIPNHPISLSNTPFRVSEASCSRLSVLTPCNLIPDCSSNCDWECKLTKNPAQLVAQCGSMHHSVSSEQGCQNDVLDYMDRYLKMGLEIKWDEEQDSYFSSCRSCQAKNGVCGYNSTDPDKRFICFKSEARSLWIRNHSMDRISIVCSILFFVSLSTITIGVIIIRSRRFKCSESEEDPTTMFLNHHRSANQTLPPVFTYEELQSSTNKFDKKRKIGDGGFGSVFLGNLNDGRIVAVKHLHRQQTSPDSNQSFFTKSFCNEILILSSINHPSLVKLHGYCSDPRGLLLVYDYVPNGTLSDHLHGPSPKNTYIKGSMTWQVRIDIALQIATAMEYLHFAIEPSIVHRDLTSSNIFIERDMRVKVGDFGLSRLLMTSSSSSSDGHVWTGPQGTPGYLDPDYHRSFRLTEKSDVYSFGVVLLELVTGMRAVDQNREKREMALADLVVSRIHMGLLHQVVDPVLVVGGVVVDGVGAVAELAFRCVAADKDDRPDSKEVVEVLSRIRSRTRVSVSSGVDAV